MRTIPAILLAALLIAPGTRLWATDYSSLFDPRYARILVLPGKRVQQAECAGLALHFAETRPAFAKEMASRIADAVTRRLSVELGDPEVARGLVENKAANHVDIGYEPETRVAVVDILEGHCKPLFEEASKGDAALEAALGPVPSNLVELPDPGQCLAVMSYADERRAVDEAGYFKGLLQEAWIDGTEGAEQTTRAAKVMTAISMLRSLAPSNYDLHDMTFACFPTMQDAISKMKKTKGAQ